MGDTDERGQRGRLAGKPRPRAPLSLNRLRGDLFAIRARFSSGALPVIAWGRGFARPSTGYLHSLGLPGVCTAVIGFGTPDEVRQAVAVARAYRPLSAGERAALLAEGQKLAQARGLYYGPVSG